MKRRIAFISEHASPLATLGGVDAGGQNLYVGQLAKHLASLGYEIDIFTRWDDARLPAVLEWDKGVRVIHIKAGPIAFLPKEELFRYMDEFSENMAQFIKEQRDHYRLIHANFWMSGYVASEIKKKFNIPFVITFHALGKIRRLFQGENDCFPKQRIRIETQVIKDAAYVVAECPQDKDDFIKHYHADPKKIEMIPCGFDQSEFYPIDKLLARMVLNFDSDDKIILQLGRIVRRKGIDNVVRALPHLRKKHGVKAKLLIVGGNTDVPNARLTPEIGRLKQVARQHKVSDVVFFAGRRSREALKYFYNAADVFVTTPWYEPFGITPLEAMACGTPVVGSNVGGIKYSVQDKKSGFLVEPNNPEGLADRLADILKNKKIANLFRENSIKWVNAQFTWEKVAGQASKLYERVILRSGRYFENAQDGDFQFLGRSANSFNAIYAQDIKADLKQRK